MDWTALQIGLLEITLAAIVGMMVIYGGFLLFSKLTRGVNEVEEIRRDNRAVAVAFGGNLLAVALIVREVLYPISATLQDLVLNPWTLISALKALGYTGTYLVITAGAAIVSMLLATHIFTILTRDIDEKLEIARGNIAAAIFYASAAVAIALFVAEGAGSLTKALIPRPQIISHAFSFEPSEESLPKFPLNR